MAYGVKCNVKAPHRFLRMGALCWIVNPNAGWGGEHVEVRGITRGGRKVRTWVDARDLHNFRPGWLPDDLPEELLEYSHRFADWSEAHTWATAMQQKYGAQPVREHAANHGKDPHDAR